MYLRVFYDATLGKPRESKKRKSYRKKFEVSNVQYPRIMGTYSIYLRAI